MEMKLGTPLAPKWAQNHINDLFAGRDSIVFKDEIIQAVKDRHLALGGVEGAKPVSDRVSSTFQRMKNAEHEGMDGGRPFWSINRIICGSGKNYVYCYYYCRDQQEAIEKKEQFWRCNIGRTAKADYLVRIKAQIDIVKGEYRVPLVIKTDNAEKVESEIHQELKDSGRQLRDQGKNEDFDTCPSEVMEIYKKIAKKL